VGRRRFHDRAEAGGRLADELARRGESAPGGVVVGLPRGGVVVAASVAAQLGLPLDVVVVRKVGAPQQPELGIGAVAEGGVEVVARQRARDCGVDDEHFAQLAAAERARVEARVALYRQDRPRVALAGRDVIVVDDGFATGVTAQAAIEALRREQPARLVLAVPVAPPDVADIVGPAADAVVAVLTPSSFRAVGEFYDRFDQTTDAEVIALLHSPDPPF
jgi:putative phosphoribosyl transferase